MRRWVRVEPPIGEVVEAAQRGGTRARREGERRGEGEGVAAGPADR